MLLSQSCPPTLPPAPEAGTDDRKNQDVSFSLNPKYQDNKMISTNIEKALNAQINAEFWSAYLYLSMSCRFASDNYKGIANWFKIQHREEMDHAYMMIDYLVRRGGKVTLEPIADVPAEWGSPQEAFADTLAHEEKVTSMINALYAAAEAEHDYATRQMLNWYVAEQVEEEDSVHDILDSLKRIGTDATGLYQFDLELAKRVYTDPKAE